MNKTEKIQNILHDFHEGELNAYAALEYINRLLDESYNQALEDCLSKAFEPTQTWITDDIVLVEDIKKLKKT